MTIGLKYRVICLTFALLAVYDFHIVQAEDIRVYVDDTSDCYKRTIDPSDTLFIEYNGAAFSGLCSIVVDTEDVGDSFCIAVTNLNIPACDVELRVYNFDISISPNKTFSCGDSIPSYDLCTTFSDTRIEIDHLTHVQRQYAAIHLKVYVVDDDDDFGDDLYLPLVWIIIGSCVGGILFIAAAIGLIVMCIVCTRKRRAAPPIVYRPGTAGGTNMTVQYQAAPGAGPYPTQPQATVQQGQAMYQPPPAYPGYPPTPAQQQMTGLKPSAPEPDGQHI